MRDARFSDGDRGEGQEDRTPKEEFLSPVSEEYVEESIPAVDSGTQSASREVSPAEKTRQIGVILTSRSFRGAPLLQKFLTFITSESSAGRHEELSEYVIATQVFGRPANFDPASDTIVRTQAYRLRTKLKEYYENEGKEDRVIVEVPKGRYIPSFSLRPEPEAMAQAEESAQGVTGAGSLDSSQRESQLPRIFAVVVLAIAVAFAAGVWVGRRFFPRSSATAAQSVPEMTARFWKDFAGGKEIIIAYTSETYLITETADLLRLHQTGALGDRGSPAGKEASRINAINPALAMSAGPLYYEKGFTGTGEVLAAYRLASLLTRLGIEAHVKRSGLVTVDDLQNRDVIFLGSPWGNALMAEWKLPQRFTFQGPPEPPMLWHGRIVDGTPTASGVRLYELERDPENQMIRADYALFDVLPGRAAGRRIMVLAGLTTSGTQGAADFATSADGLRHILGLQGGAQDERGGGSFPRYFESVLRVEAERGLEAINVKFVEGSIVQAQK